MTNLKTEQLKNVPVKTNVDPDTYARLVSKAEREDRTISSAVRQAIRQYLVNG